MKNGTLHTLAEAKAALQDGLKRDSVDNPVAATRVLTAMARRFRPEGASSWDAFQLVAERELAPFFNGSSATPAKAVSWTLLEVLQWEADRETWEESSKYFI